METRKKKNFFPILSHLKKNGIQRTTVVVSIAFEVRHISILDIIQLKYPITNQSDDNLYVFHLTYGLVSSEKCSAIMKRTSLITMT